MWLTDTAYQNKRLVNSQGENPWWIGPVLLHMRKTPQVFSRFALEIVINNPMIGKLPFLGTDLEKALFQGFKAVCPDLKNLLCLKHMSDRDKKKLTELKAQNQRSIIADIYGKNDGVVRELGLASAIDQCDFEVKLNSLHEKWEELAPGFYDWFYTRRAELFINNVICSAREEAGFIDLFYNNAIESLHSVLKVETSGRKLPLVDLITALKRVIHMQETEEVRALYQSGKYRLSKGYRQFQVKMLS